MEYYLPNRTIHREVDFMWRKYMQELENLKETHKAVHQDETPCIVAKIIRRTKELIVGEVEEENIG